MSRPEFITHEEIERWSEKIDKDELLASLPADFSQSPIIREVCYAGLWLVESLQNLNCPETIIARIQWQAGALSFGRDTWDVHQQILQDYKDNKLIFETDPDEPSN
jgi:hypothetical protein